MSPGFAWGPSIPPGADARESDSPSVIARSASDEATQLPARTGWIASLTLAMTRNRNRSRDACASELCLRPRPKIDSPPAHAWPRKVASGFRTGSCAEKGGEAPKGACRPWAARRRRCRELAPRLLRGCAPYRSAPAFRRFGRGSRRDSHPCSAPGHASWDVDKCVIRKSGYRFSEKITHS